MDCWDSNNDDFATWREVLADLFSAAHPNLWGLLGLTLVLAGCVWWAP
jgi:hypothetical protein